MHIAPPNSQKSSFKIATSGYNAQKSSFEIATFGCNAQKSSFEIATSGYNAQKSSFEIATSGYNAQKSSFEIATSGYNAQKSSFEIATFGYNAQKSSFEIATFGYNSHKSSFEITTSGYNSQKSSFEIATSGYNAQKSPFEKATSKYNSQKSSFEIATSRCNAQKSSFKIATSRYNAPKSSFEIATSGYNAQKSSFEIATSGYNAQKSSFEIATSGYDAQKSSFEIATSRYNSKKSSFEIATFGYNSQKSSFEIATSSLRSGKHRSSRKRKRKFGGPHTQPKKKQQQQQQQHSTSDLKGVKVRATVEPLLSTPLNNSSIADPPPPPSQDRVHTGKSAEGEGCGDEKEKHGNANNVETAEQTTENGYAYISLQDEQKKESEVDPKLSELKGTISIEEVDAGKFSIHFPYTRTSELDVPTDELSKGELAEPVQSNRFTGAKKRKSGFVRRFKQDSAPCEPAEALNAIGRSTIESYDKVEPLGSEDADSMGDYATDKNKLDDSINPFSIMKIIKPIGYMASLSNDVQDVSVTFVAMRWLDVDAALEASRSSQRSRRNTLRSKNKSSTSKDKGKSIAIVEDDDETQPLEEPLETLWEDLDESELEEVFVEEDEDFDGDYAVGDGLAGPLLLDTDADFTPIED
ncbi:hypothetical protein HHK36_028349 [Tetracentron sinense]|uniref:Uncharacterized protein n=1 Tax=Tetracentron sinense TaxID=13715 RepID=A0A834YGE5_TETSI|nr:hypothetical protein HHK36_028349 [Tetracentron sinense]